MQATTISQWHFSLRYVTLFCLSCGPNFYEVFFFLLTSCCACQRLTGTFHTLTGVVTWTFKRFCPMEIQDDSRVNHSSQFKALLPCYGKTTEVSPNRNSVSVNKAYLWILGGRSAVVVKVVCVMMMCHTATVFFFFFWHVNLVSYHSLGAWGLAFSFFFPSLVWTRISFQRNVCINKPAVQILRLNMQFKSGRIFWTHFSLYQEKLKIDMWLSAEM